MDAVHVFAREPITGNAMPSAFFPLSTAHELQALVIILARVTPSVPVASTRSHVEAIFEEVMRDRCHWPRMHQGAQGVMEHPRIIYWRRESHHLLLPELDHVVRPSTLILLQVITGHITQSTLLRHS